MEVYGVSITCRLVDVAPLPGHSARVCKGFSTPHRLVYRASSQSSRAILAYRFDINFLAQLAFSIWKYIHYTMTRCRTDDEFLALPC